MTRIFIFLALAMVAFAAEPLRPRNTSEMPRVFSASCDMSLSGTAGACTIQQPTSGGNNVRLISASVYCSVACTVSQKRNGTAATATPATVRSVNDKGTTATANVFTSSNVGAGSMAVDPIELTASVENKLGYDNTVYLIGSDTGKNYTWSAASMTGRFKVIVMWEEYN